MAELHALGLELAVAQVAFLGDWETDVRVFAFFSSPLANYGSPFLIYLVFCGDLINL